MNGPIFFQNTVAARYIGGVAFMVRKSFIALTCQVQSLRIILQPLQLIEHQTLAINGTTCGPILKKLKNFVAHRESTKASSFKRPS